MTFRGMNYEFRTICEVLREINDLHQTNSERDKETRTKLIEAEKMAKRMAKKLLEYNSKYHKDFWESTNGMKYKNVLKKRLNKSYLVG